MSVRVSWMVMREGDLNVLLCGVAVGCIFWAVCCGVVVLPMRARVFRNPSSCCLVLIIVTDRRHRLTADWRRPHRSRICVSQGHFCRVLDALSQTLALALALALVMGVGLDAASLLLIVCLC